MVFCSTLTYSYWYKTEICSRPISASKKLTGNSVFIAVFWLFYLIYWLKTAALYLLEFVGLSNRLASALPTHPCRWEYCNNVRLWRDEGGVSKHQANFLAHYHKSNLAFQVFTLCKGMRERLAFPEWLLQKLDFLVRFVTRKLVSIQINFKITPYTVTFSN